MAAITTPKNFSFFWGIRVWSLARLKPRERNFRSIFLPSNRVFIYWPIIFPPFLLRFPSSLQFRRSQTLPRVRFLRLPRGGSWGRLRCKWNTFLLLHFFSQEIGILGSILFLELKVEFAYHNFSPFEFMSSITFSFFSPAILVILQWKTKGRRGMHFEQFARKRLRTGEDFLRERFPEVLQLYEFFTCTGNNFSFSLVLTLSLYSLIGWK